MKEFPTLQELHKHLIDNKKSIMAEKKGVFKQADAMPFINVTISEKGEVNKSEEVEMMEDDRIRVKVVINTTNLIDSHRDMHVKGIWKKSINDNPKRKLLESHGRNFKDVISSNAIASVKSMSWKSLGYDYEGNTEALIFDVEIDKDRHETMYKQYKNGYVDNHSVGMQYVNYLMAVNSDESWAKEEKANWDKYYPMVANKEVADEYGYFYPTLEAKVIEGSAVVFGSNSATPTLSVKSKEPEITQEDATPEPINTQIDIEELKQIVKQTLKLK